MAACRHQNPDLQVSNVKVHKSKGHRFKARCSKTQSSKRSKADSIINNHSNMRCRRPEAEKMVQVRVRPGAWPSGLGDVISRIPNFQIPVLIQYSTLEARTAAHAAERSPEPEDSWV